MMRKFLYLIVTIMISACLVVACGKDDLNEGGTSKKENASENNKVESNADYFEWDSMDESVICGYSEAGLRQTELVIPKECTRVYGLENNAVVKKITFENPDTIVESSAFRKCTKLETFEFPANLEIIEMAILDGCENLKSVKLPEKIKEIQSYAFSNCKSLKELELNNTLEVIGSDAFEGCESLTEIVLPDSVSVIEKHAFENCIALEKVEFGDGVNTIGEYAFHKCNSLKIVRLNEGVKEIGEFAFAYCDSLNEIYFPSTVEKIHSTSIEQLHKIKMYVKTGSWIDQKSISDFLGVEIEKDYY